MNNEDFIRAKQQAIERMMAFGGASPEKGNRPPDAPPFIKFKGEHNGSGGKCPESSPHKTNALPFDLGRIDIPFLDRLKTDKDIGLVLGLLLLLLCENTDRLTLIALVYILL